MRISDWSADVCSSDLTGKAQQLRRFVAQCHDLLDAFGVIVLAGARPLVGGAGVVGAIKLGAQRAIFGAEAADVDHAVMLARSAHPVADFVTFDALACPPRPEAGRVGTGCVGTGKVW